MFTLYTRFLDNIFCDYLATNYRYFTTPDLRHEFWSAHKIDDPDIMKAIITAYSPILPSNKDVGWCTITQYTKGRYLPMHKDGKSSLTFTSTITENYTGGRFIIGSEHYLEMNKGDVVSFNGTEVLHGVEEVIHGERLSLNIWTTDKPTKI